MIDRLSMLCQRKSSSHSKEKVWTCQSEPLSVKRKSRKKIKIALLVICASIFVLCKVRSQLREVPDLTEESNAQKNVEHSSLSEPFDYTYCSVLSPLKIYVRESKHPLAKALSSHPSAVRTPESACFIISVGDAKTLVRTADRSKNIMLINVDPEREITPVANEMIVQASFTKGSFRNLLDISLFANVKSIKNTTSGRSSILPLGREIPSQFVYGKMHELEDIPDEIRAVRCIGHCERNLMNTSFCLLPSSPSFQRRLLSSLRAGCIPVVLSSAQPLPFQNELDWRLASLRYPLPAIKFVPQLLERLTKEDILELRRRGRIFLSRIDNAEALAETLIAALSERIMVELSPFIEHAQTVSHSASDKASTRSRILPPPASLYSYRRWNSGYKLKFAPSLLHDLPMMPGGAAFHKGTNEKIVPMNSEIGKSNRALGLTRDEEQFTVVILTYDRIDGVNKILENLKGCPFLNKVIVIWNNKKGSPPADWLHRKDPVEVIITKKNSLNNRFIPYESIETEAVVSMDDDVYVSQAELVFAFRMWRENRNRIVGFPDRYHSEVNGKSKYGLVAQHEYSLILTGLAIIHKEFLFEFTYNQHPAILEFIDKHFNCEDLAMNYLVAHLTRRPPLRVQKRTSLSNGSKVGLFSRIAHMRERDECIDMLNKFYGYNPLLFSQEVAVPLQDQCVHPSWRSTLFGL